MMLRHHHHSQHYLVPSRINLTLIFCGNIHCFIVHGRVRLQKITYYIAVTGNITSQDVVPDGYSYGDQVR